MPSSRPLHDSTSRGRFRAQLLRWYDRAQRRLPWRRETDPYRILVSEIMLQQTRVAVVEERYPEFLKKFPTAERLARAREDRVLAAWSGLGYYRRARSLQAAARHMDQNGGFPGSSAELLELPGIGRYTAAAVASIAFGEPVAVVDGNVKRVLDRLTGRSLQPGEYWQAAGQLLDPRRPGDFNQAMMELGATICLPRGPRCAACPVFKLCVTQGATARERQAPRRKAVLAYALRRNKDGEVFLQRRGAGESLMPGMWELPPADRAASRRKLPLLKLRHSITTTDYQVEVFAAGRPAAGSGRWFSLRAATRLPLTGLARKILGKIAAIELFPPSNKISSH